MSQRLVAALLATLCLAGRLEAQDAPIVTEDPAKLAPVETATPEPTPTPSLAEKFRARVVLLKQGAQQLAEQQRQVEEKLEQIKAQRLAVQGALLEIGVILNEE